SVTPQADVVPLVRWHAESQCESEAIDVEADRLRHIAGTKNRLDLTKRCDAHLDIAYCAGAAEGGGSDGAGPGAGWAPRGMNGSIAGFPPERPPKPKNRRGGRQKLSPRSERSAINWSVMLTSATCCLALAQNFLTACLVWSPSLPSVLPWKQSS